MLKKINSTCVERGQVLFKIQYKYVCINMCVYITAVWKNIEKKIISIIYSGWAMHFLPFFDQGGGWNTKANEHLLKKIF